MWGALFVVAAIAITKSEMGGKEIEQGMVFTPIVEFLAIPLGLFLAQVLYFAGLYRVTKPDCQAIVPSGALLYAVWLGWVFWSRPMTDVGMLWKICLSIVFSAVYIGVFFVLLKPKDFSWKPYFHAAPPHSDMEMVKAANRVEVLHEITFGSHWYVFPER